MLKFGNVVITRGFWLTLVISLMMGAAEVLPLIAVAVLLHEMGHLLALRVFGISVEVIYFTAFGVEMRADTRFIPYWQELVCTLAGPGMNILAALFLSRLAEDYLLAGTNILQGVFNLLPLTGLDGSRALYLMISWLIDPVCADRVCCFVELVCALLLVACSLYLTVCCGTGGFLLLAVIGIFINIWREIFAKQLA